MNIKNECQIKKSNLSAAFTEEPNYLIQIIYLFTFNFHFRKNNRTEYNRL